MSTSKPSKYLQKKLAGLAWDAVVGEYMADLWLQAKDDDTLKAYRRTLDCFKAFMLQGQTGSALRMRDLSNQRARAFVESRLNQNVLYADHPFHKPREGKLSLHTVHKDVRGLQTFGNWLERRGYENPFHSIPKPKLPKRLVSVLMPDEIRKLFDVYNLYTTVGARWAALLSFAMGTGARLNEMVTLEVSQVNLDLRRANVIGKGNEERVIRFGDRMLLALSRYTHLFRDNGKAAVSLFVSLEGDPLTVDGAEKIIERVRYATGIKRLHWHLLRHTFATYYLALQRAPVELLQEWYGPASE
jgi:site-specific recombinase XerD